MSIVNIRRSGGKQSVGRREKGTLVGGIMCACVCVAYTQKYLNLSPEFLIYRVFEIFRDISLSFNPQNRVEAKFSAWNARLYVRIHVIYSLTHGGSLGNFVIEIRLLTFSKLCLLLSPLPSDYFKLFAYNRIKRGSNNFLRLSYLSVITKTVGGMGT